MERERRHESSVRHAEHRLRRARETRLPPTQRYVPRFHAGIAFILSALAAVVVFPVMLEYLGLSNAADLLIRIARWPRDVSCRSASRSSTALVRAAKRRVGDGSPGAAPPRQLRGLRHPRYSRPTANFGTFNETYGSLGAAIGFMTWLWISAIAILLGAELNAEMEHQPPASLARRNGRT